MIKKLLVLVFVTTFSNLNFAQTKLTEIEKLTATAKVWGFLKYYHPQVADGKFDWDKHLFEILPKVKNASNKEELSQVFIDWVDNLGKVKPCKKCKSHKDSQFFDKNFNLDWLNHKNWFTAELSKKLTYVEDNRHQGKKHYVTHYSKGLKIADFKNEKDYKGFDWQDQNLRLLSLFRYWNMIEYFFPYKYQTDLNWENVLVKMLPKFLDPTSETELHLAMVELINNIDDSHAVLKSSLPYFHFGDYFLPVEIKVIEDLAVVTNVYNDSLARLNDLKIGDIISEANDKNIQMIFKEKENYIMGSNLSVKKLNARFYLLNGSNDSLKVKVTRKGKTSTRIVNRYPYHNFHYKLKTDTKAYAILDGNIGYINIGAVTDVPGTMDALKDTKALIFDIRKSTAETPYYFTKFITSNKKTFYKALIPDLDYPGKFIWNQNSPIGHNGLLKYKGKVILLVDESCQSQREFSAMCLQIGDNVTTIGRQTSGADGNVSIFNMVGGFETQMSGVGIFYPDGSEAQRKGVKIDIQVNHTIQGIIDGKDEILDKAIEFINE